MSALEVAVLLANKLAVKRAELAALSEETKEVQKAHDAIEAELFEALENAGIGQIRVDHLGLFSLSDLAWPKIDDEAAARAWADAEFPEAITLNRQRLQTLVRGRLKKNEDLPPGIGYTVTRKINWRKPTEGPE